ncbi:MAG: UDP-N-acetylglucosamine 1-carboxyvinyltransferase [Lachnospiraceae bacterium]
MKTQNILVRGSGKLAGTVSVQGSKNSALPLLASSLLCRDVTILYNCPQITDIDCMVSIMRELGCKIIREGHKIIIDSRQLSSTDISSYYGSQMRASVILLGALLAREKYASVGVPGGCKIGARPIDIHLKGLSCLGAQITQREERIILNCERLLGGEITLSYPSVGATENLIMAAVLAKGRTVLYNCAMEPEIDDLVLHLIQMGAKIKGVGTKVLTIDGVKQLYGVKCHVPFDRIVAGTYLLGAMHAKGEVRLQNIQEAKRLESVLLFLKKMGAFVEICEEEIGVYVEKPLRGIHIHTRPYPGIPTDLQSVFLVLATNAIEMSFIYENIFESRFRVANELKKMGADITVHGNKAMINPVKKLHGAKVVATDLRGGAALVIAGVAAEGETEIEQISYIQRGYEDIVKDLSALGAKVTYKDC